MNTYFQDPKSERKLQGLAFMIAEKVKMASHIPNKTHFPLSVFHPLTGIQRETLICQF